MDVLWVSATRATRVLQRPSSSDGSILELPESVVFTFTHIPEAVLSDLANQILWQGLVVGNLKGALPTQPSASRAFVFLRCGIDHIRFSWAWEELNLRPHAYQATKGE
jgi:hypothetical protein